MDPSQPRLTTGSQILTTIALLYIIGKYNSDRDMLDQSSKSLDTITLVTHPGGENHELANNHINHDISITFSDLLPWRGDYE